MTKNYFFLFGLKPSFNIDLPLLEQHYRKIQLEAHPDKFVSATPAEKLQSMQLATLANEAYHVLKEPGSRAQYLLSLNNIDATDEANTSMPPAFLMQQMEWREGLEDLKAAKDINGLEDLLDEMQQAANALSQELTTYFDEAQDLSQATEGTRKLIFIAKVCADISKTIDELDE